MRGWLLLLGACNYAPSIGGAITDGAVDAADPDATITVDTSADASTEPWLAGFTHRQPITITRTTGTSTLVDFPVAINLATNAGLAQHASNAGSDLVITADDAVTRLDSQLVGFDGSNGKTELWVRVPALAAGTTSLFLYYGATAQDTHPDAVWPAQFRAVWHLSETAGAAANDSAGNHTLDQPNAAFLPGRAEGVAGLARRMDGIDDRVELADPVNGSLDFGTSSFSYSIWVNANANLGQFDQPFYKGGTSSSLPGYAMLLGTGAWAGKLHDGNSFRDIDFAQNPTLNAWHHLVVVIDRQANVAKGYFDGAESSSIPFPLGSIDSTEPMRIGRGSGGAQFSGLTDEAHVVSGVLAPDWIATEHANLATPGFVSIGAEQSE
jgi:hypothetical protein